MCGFGVEVRPGGRPDPLERMGESLAPRGPDGAGLWLDGSAGFVHRRLAVIDLSERGAQPMLDEALGLSVVFNGCIYNHRELRAELESLATPRCCSRAGRSGARACSTGWPGCSRSACMRSAPDAWCSRATGSASSRCTWSTCRAAPCARRRRCPRSGAPGLLKAAARGVVPDAVIDRDKGYFPVPALSHLEGPVLELVTDALTSGAARSRGLFRTDVVRDMLADPNAHRTNLDGSTLWQLALLELWLQRHVG